MAGLRVRIERLAPMRVASARALSETPEQDAWELLRAWAGPMGLLADSDAHPVFGFNNPSPSPERKEYGYEFWIRIGADVAPSPAIEIREFPGGLYAVTTCPLLGDHGVVQTWKDLWNWVKRSEYRWRRTHELEKVQNPLAPPEELVLELYLPIEG
jgi:DNA gyrase inhibitor GyrI